MNAFLTPEQLNIMRQALTEVDGYIPDVAKLEAIVRVLIPEVERLNAELAETRYEQACKAIAKHRDRAEALVSTMGVLRDYINGSQVTASHEHIFGLVTEAIAADVEALNTLPPHERSYWDDSGESGAPGDVELALVQAYDAVSAAGPDGEGQTEEVEYLVWSNEAQQWWKANGAGYTHRIFSAGRYNRAEAVKACNMRTWSLGTIPPEVMVPAPPAALLDAMQAIHDGMPSQIQAANIARIAERDAGLPASAPAGQTDEGECACGRPLRNGECRRHGRDLVATTSAPAPEEAS